MIRSIKALGQRYRGELVFSLASYTTPAVGLWASVLSAMYLSPQELGSIQSILLILPYAGFLQLGVINGLSRNLAFYMGRDEMDTAQRMINATAFVVNVVSVIGLLIGSGVLFMKAQEQPFNRIEVYASVALISSLVCMPQNNYLGSLFRSGQHFKKLGQITFLENSARFLYAMLPAVMGWSGRILGEVVRPVISVVLRRTYRPYFPSGGFSFQDVKLLLHAGAPLLAASYLMQLLSVADQSLIAVHFEKVNLGYYSLSRLLITAMMIIPSTMSVLLYPKAAALYGRTGKPAALRGFFWKALLFNLAIFLPICLLAYFLLGPVVRIFLPEYLLGLDAAKVNVLTCMTLVSAGPSVIAGVLKKMGPVIFFYGVGLGCMWAGGQYICLSGSPDIVDIAWLRFFVSMVLSLAIIGYNYWLTTRTRAHVSYT